MLRNTPLDKTLDYYSTKAKDKQSTFNIMQIRKYAMRKYNSLLLFNFKYIFNKICKIRFFFFFFFFLETNTHTRKSERCLNTRTHHKHKLHSNYTATIHSFKQNGTVTHSFLLLLLFFLFLRFLWLIAKINPLPVTCPVSQCMDP